MIMEDDGEIIDDNTFRRHICDRFGNVICGQRDPVSVQKVTKLISPTAYAARTAEDVCFVCSRALRELINQAIKTGSLEFPPHPCGSNGKEIDGDFYVERANVKALV